MNKRIVVLMFAFLSVLYGCVMQVHAFKGVKLAEKKKVLYVEKYSSSSDETYKIKVKKSKGVRLVKVTYNSNNPSVASVSNGGMVSAKSVGNTVITASVKYKIKKKKYTKKLELEVQVNQKGISVYNHDSDIKVLNSLINEQKQRGAAVNSNVLSSEYTWGTDGRLKEINWEAKNLSGEISFEDLTSLEKVNCGDNQLISIDVSKNVELISLNCSYNQLLSVNIGDNTKLEVLHCENNQINQIDLSKCLALKELYCSDNRITSLDISFHTALTRLECQKNRLSSLDINMCTALNYLNCNTNKLSELNVSTCVELVELHCTGGTFKSIDMTNCKKAKLVEGDYITIGYNGNKYA